MRFIHRIVIVLLLVISSSVSNSQITTTDAYIISNTNDTVFGRMEYSNSGFSKNCVFVRDNSKNIEYLSADQINGFFISPNFLFKKKLLNGENHFLQVLSGGKIDLYFEEAGNGLYISDSDSLTKLLGGTETVYINYKPYERENYLYKMQLKRYIKDTSYYKIIDNIVYDKKPILELVNEVNEIDGNRVSTKLYNASHFGVEINYEIHSIELSNVDYSETLAVYNKGEWGNQYLRFPSITMGCNYKRKLGKTKSYFRVALLYNMSFPYKEERSAILYSYYNTSHGPVGPHGKIIDKYSSDQKSIVLPISLYNEFSNRSLRFYCDVGLAFRYYLNKNININREIYEFGELVEVRDIKLTMPSVLYGPKIGIGSRYLINSRNSISTGINAEFFRADRPGKNFISSLYLSYNF